MLQRLPLPILMDCYLYVLFSGWHITEWVLWRHFHSLSLPMFTSPHPCSCLPLLCWLLFLHIVPCPSVLISFYYYCVCHSAHLGVRWQRLGVSSLLPGFLGLNSGHQAGWQVFFTYSAISLARLLLSFFFKSIISFHKLGFFDMMNYFMFNLFLPSFLFWDVLSCSPGWCPTGYRGKDELGLLVLLPLFPKWWAYDHEPPRLV